MNTNKEIAIKLIASPILALFGMALISLVFLDASIILGLTLFLPITIAFCIVIGFPLVRLLNYNEINNYLSYIAISGAIGFLLGLLVSNFIFVSGYLYSALIGMIYGMISGIVYVRLGKSDLESFFKNLRHGMNHREELLKDSRVTLKSGSRIKFNEKK